MIVATADGIVGVAMEKKVEVRDQYGNVCPLFTGAVAMKIDSPAGVKYVDGTAKIEFDKGVGYQKVTTTVVQTATFGLTDSYKTNLNVSSSVQTFFQHSPLLLALCFLTT